MKDATDVEVEPEKPWLRPGVIDSPVFQPPAPTESVPTTPPTATMSSAFVNSKPLKAKPKNGKKPENGEINTQKEESFDPHTVATAQTAEEQKQSEEMRELLAKGNIIPPEAVRPPDIDVSGIRAPQYENRAGMRSAMNKLNQKVDTRTDAEKLAEAEEGLRVLPGMFGAPPVTAEPATEPDGRIEPTLGSNEEPLNDTSSTPDTRKEWTDKLREAVGKVVEGTKEKFNWYKSSSEKLIRRREELDAQLESIGGKLGIERGFRWMGEKYNKMPFKYKVALGATLGVGAVVTAGSLAMTLPLLGIAGQRAAGLATMYLKFEKNSHQEKWGKEKAMLKAGAYTVLLGLTMKEAIEYASQTEIAHAAQAKVEGWLGTMLGHESPPPSESTKLAAAPKDIAEAPKSAPAPEVAATEAAPASPPEVPAATEATPASAPAEVPASAASEAATAAPAPEMPDISVEATKGRGYEYMMKRMWEQLQDKGLDANKFEADSDIHKLLMADEKSIDSVVHRIAMDPKHGFFHPDGTSVRIDMGAQMTVNAEGNIQLGDAVKAPEGAPVTPVVHHPEAMAPTPKTIVSPPHAETVDLTAAQDEAAKHISPPPLQEAPVPATPDTPSVGEHPLAWRTGSGGELVDSSGNPVHAGVSESLPGANSFGIVVPEAIPHIYADPNAERLFAYGGSSTERATLISEYLRGNPNKIVFAADDSGKRVPWHLVEGKAVAGPPMRASGLMSLFSPWMKAPSPNDLAKVIK